MILSRSNSIFRGNIQLWCIIVPQETIVLPIICWVKSLMNFIRREIYNFNRSLQERTVRMDCLLLLDKVEVPEGLDNISTHTVRVSSVVMKKLSGVQSSESIEAIALMKIPTSFFSIDVNQKEADCRSWFPSIHRILVLDGIQVNFTYLEIFYFALLSNFDH